MSGTSDPAPHEVELQLQGGLPEEQEAVLKPVMKMSRYGQVIGLPERYGLID